MKPSGRARFVSTVAVPNMCLWRGVCLIGKANGLRNPGN